MIHVILIHLAGNIWNDYHHQHINMIINNNNVIIVIIIKVSLLGRTPIVIASFADLERAQVMPQVNIVGMSLFKVVSLNMPHSQSHTILELDYMEK